MTIGIGNFNGLKLPSCPSISTTSEISAPFGKENHECPHNRN
ncbi:hypothetical protein [Winogradskyella sp.]